MTAPYIDSCRGTYLRCRYKDVHNNRPGDCLWHFCQRGGWWVLMKYKYMGLQVTQTEMLQSIRTESYRQLDKIVLSGFWS